MEEWLRRLATLIPAPFRAPAETIIGGMLRLWTWVYGLLRSVRNGWSPLATASQWLTGGMSALGREAHDTLRWVILVKIPAWARHSIDTSVRWAADQVSAARGIAQGLVVNAVTWARDQIDVVRDELGQARAWLFDRVSALWGDVLSIKDRLGGVLATPERVATWIAGAMWVQLWRYAYSQLDAIAASLWRQRQTLILRGVAEIERIIGRLI